jgi:putative addiction module CopG family antidote
LSKGDFAMTTNVSLENERFIQQAIAEGRFTSRNEVINQAMRLLREESEINGSGIAHSETAEEWIAELRRWSASHRHIEHPVDFDRDAIYAGRGE